MCVRWRLLTSSTCSAALVRCMVYAAALTEQQQRASSSCDDGQRAFGCSCSRAARAASLWPAARETVLLMLSGGSSALHRAGEANVHWIATACACSVALARCTAYAAAHAERRQRVASCSGYGQRACDGGCSQAARVASLWPAAWCMLLLLPSGSSALPRALAMANVHSAAAAQGQRVQRPSVSLHGVCCCSC